MNAFFFARRSARPFGLLRIGWAAVTLAFLLMQWRDIAAYYGDDGFLPRALTHLVTRSDLRFSLLNASGDAVFAHAVYALLLLSLISTIVGWMPRVSMIASFVLLASFHERNPLTLGGGDTLLRNIGFILMLAPGIGALSLSRLRKQYAQWRKNRSLLPPATMPAWPYRLLLWQMIVLYGMSLWWKLLGTMWLDGTAVGAALHHPLFLRWPQSVVNLLLPAAPAITYATLAFEACWLLLLIPSSFLRPLPVRIPFKRLLLVAGVIFHGSIALVMDVGSFSFAVLAAYLGLLDDTERSSHAIIVLYDGQCRLCRRSAFVLAILDTFNHLSLVDFRDTAARKHVAPHLTESQLDLAMHILLPDQSVRTGFDAFRFMTRHLPALWPATPFLYLPGVSHLGRLVYARIARNRQKCSHDRC